MEGEGNRRTINDKNSEKDSLWGNKKRVGPCSAICSLDFTCSFSIFKCKFQNVCSQTLPEGFVIIFQLYCSFSHFCNSVSVAYFDSSD